MVLMQGAGGVITDWSGRDLHWLVESDDVVAPAGQVLAAGDSRTHKQALDLLAWHEHSSNSKLA